MLLSTALLALGIAAVWLPTLRLGSRCAIPPALLMLGLALGAALVDGTVRWQGAIALSVLVAIACISKVAVHRLTKACFSAAGVVAAFLIGSGLAPGFNNVVLTNNMRASLEAPAVRLTVSFHVAATGLVLLLVYCRRTRSFAELKEAVFTVLPTTAITTIVVLSLGCLVGFVKPDVKLPPFTVDYLFRTIFWTCVLEEAFFRGVIQEVLAASQGVLNWKRLRWLPIGISSALFGLAHLRGGWTYVALATAAGVGYGLAYAKTRRIESSMFAHFFLNTVHFLGFTYPYLERNG